MSGDLEEAVISTELIEATRQWTVGAVNALACAFVNIISHDPRIDAPGECVKSLDFRSRELYRLQYERDLKPAGIAERFGGRREHRGESPAAGA